MTVIYDWEVPPIEPEWIDFETEPLEPELDLPYISKIRILVWQKRKNFPWVV